MEELSRFLSVFPDHDLVSRFINSIRLNFGGLQDGDSLNDPTTQRFFHSVCYLNEIKHVYNDDSSNPPNMKLFVNQAINMLRNYILQVFSYEYNDRRTIKMMDSHLHRMFTKSHSGWMYCLHCEKRMLMLNYDVADVCEECGGWWLLRSFIADGVVVSGIDQLRAGENGDRIGGIVRHSLLFYVNEFDGIYPGTMFILREEQECPTCAKEMGNTVVVLGKSCNGFEDSHTLHFSCHKIWFEQQVYGMGIQNPRCPVFPHEWNYAGFLNINENRSIKNFWRIRERILTKQLER